MGDAGTVAVLKYPILLKHFGENTVGVNATLTALRCRIVV